MTAIILAMQIAPEMVKQGGKDYIGMLVSLTMVREIGVIMSGFAIISMIFLKSVLYATENRVKLLRFVNLLFTNSSFSCIMNTDLGREVQ